MKEIFIALVAGSWTETTPQDFMDGWRDPLLYVSRRLQVEGSNPADSGAIEFYARFDANRDGYYDVVGADGSGPYVRLFWGSSTGYSDSDVRLIPATSGGGCDMADLNLDGWTELIHSGNNENACKIFWGSESAGGPDPTDFTSLPAEVSEAVFVYDLDEDTYLDIIVSDAWTGLLRVYWGGPGGYDPADSSIRDDLHPHCHNTEVADLNKDGYPDIILPRRPTRGITILWGDGDRDLSNNQVWFHDNAGGMPHGLTLGDFNKDGWLDFAVSSCVGITETMVYFSDQGSFNPGYRTIVHPGVAYGGSAAWDFNEDGWLDLLVYRGEWSGNSPFPLVLYLNTRTPPYFMDQDTVSFGIEANYTGGFIYDFDGDGKTDIFANALGSSSYVYWESRQVAHMIAFRSFPSTGTTTEAS
ncbi:MAG: VCBS repeat-containing protein, partial [candidate division WOR-3 bacterium]